MRTAGRFAKRRAARGVTKAAKVSLRESLRDFWAARAELRKKSAEDASKTAQASRGAGRVPTHLRGLGRSVEVLVERSGASHADRRRQHLNTGRRMAPSTNTPHVNPGRDSKSLASGRLREELRP